MVRESGNVANFKKNGNKLCMWEINLIGQSMVLFMICGLNFRVTLSKQHEVASNFQGFFSEYHWKDNKVANYHPMWSLLWYWEQINPIFNHMKTVDAYSGCIWTLQSQSDVWHVFFYLPPNQLLLSLCNVTMFAPHCRRHAEFSEIAIELPYPDLAQLPSPIVREATSLLPSLSRPSPLPGESANLEPYSKSNNKKSPPMTTLATITSIVMPTTSWTKK